MQVVTLDEAVLKTDLPAMAGANIVFNESTNQFEGTVIDTDTFLDNADVMAIVTPAITKAIAAHPDTTRTDAEIKALAETAASAAIDAIRGEVVETTAGVQGYLIKAAG